MEHANPNPIPISSLNNDELAKILLMTNNAKLINYVFSKPPTVSIHLMRVRSKLRTKKGGINVFETIEE